MKAKGAKLGLLAVSLIGLFGFLVSGSLSIKTAQAYTPVAGSIVATPDTISAGGSTQLKWNSFNATHVSISPGVGNVDPSGSVTVSPTATTTYTLSLSNDDGGSGSGTATVYVNPTSPQTCQDPAATNYHTGYPCTYPTNPPTVHLTSDQYTVPSGSSTTLHWVSQNANSCTASGLGNWNGTKALSGQQNTDPLYNTATFYINCTNTAGQSASDSVTINVTNTQPQTCQDPSATNYGGSLPCQYYTQRCMDVNASNYGQYGSCVYNNQRCLDTNATNYGAYGSCVYNNYNYTCQDPAATNYRVGYPCQYFAQPVNNRPTVGLSADQTSLASGGATNVHWFTTNATACSASGGSVGWSGPKSIGPGTFYTGSLASGSYTYSMTCTNAYGSAMDSVTVNVRGSSTFVVRTGRVTTRRATTGTSLVLLTSTIDRTQPIQPTLDNTHPRPGDEINYTVTYQNVGTGTITNLALRLDLPQGVTYMFSNPSNPLVSGNTLIFNLGSLRGGGQGTVTVHVRVEDNVPPGTNLNFPAVLSYTDPAGYPQSVTATVSAQVGSAPFVQDQNLNPNPNLNPNELSANAFWANFFPSNLFGWLLLLILILVLIYLVRYILNGGNTPVRKTTTTIHHT